MGPAGDHEGADGSTPGEDLLAAAEGLTAAQDRRVRAREGTVRRPRRVIRGRAGDGTSGTLDEASSEERVRVRTVADEPGRGERRPPGDPAETSGTPGGPAGPRSGVMLDAQGNEIPVVPTSGGAEEPAAADRVGGATGSAAGRQTGRDAGLLTAGVFLADALRAYLDGRDTLGAAHAVTLDRLAQLRRTLDRFDQELDTD
jgi:hypothetical protein